MWSMNDSADMILTSCIYHLFYDYAFMVWRDDPSEFRNDFLL